MWNKCRFGGAGSAVCLALFLPVFAAHGAFSVVMTTDRDGGYVSHYANARSVTAAKQLAMASCSKYLVANGLSGKCAQLLSGMGPGYVVVVNALPGAPAAMGAAVAPKRQEAVNRAYALCRNGNQYACKSSPDLVAWDGGHQGLPEPQMTSSQQSVTATALR